MGWARPTPAAAMAGMVKLPGAVRCHLVDKRDIRGDSAIDDLHRALLPDRHDFETGHGGHVWLRGLRAFDGDSELRGFAETDALRLNLRRDAGLRRKGGRDEGDETEAGEEVVLERLCFHGLPIFQNFGFVGLAGAALRGDGRDFALVAFEGIEELLRFLFGHLARLAAFLRRGVGLGVLGLLAVGCLGLALGRFLFGIHGLRLLALAGLRVGLLLILFVIAGLRLSVGLLILLPILLRVGLLALRFVRLLLSVALGIFGLVLVILSGALLVLGFVLLIFGTTL